LNAANVASAAVLLQAMSCLQTQGYAHTGPMCYRLPLSMTWHVIHILTSVQNPFCHAATAAADCSRKAACPYTIASRLWALRFYEQVLLKHW